MTGRERNKKALLALLTKGAMCTGPGEWVKDRVEYSRFHLLR